MCLFMSALCHSCVGGWLEHHLTPVTLPQAATLTLPLLYRFSVISALNTSARAQGHDHGEVARVFKAQKGAGAGSARER